MRIAAIYDIHGNLPALDAVLAEIERDAPDLILVGGDVAAGPMPRQTIERLMALGDRAHFVRGNADREMVLALDSGERSNALPPAAMAQFTWSVGQLDRAHRDFLASFTPPVTFPVDGLGQVVFCHGSPRDEDEIITAITSDERLARIVAAVSQQIVVCGHTHMQFDRAAGAVRVVNAGSVGMPYEGAPGAYWCLLDARGVSLRKTDYDYASAAADVAASGCPYAGGMAADLLAPPGRDETAASFEGR